MEIEWKDENLYKDLIKWEKRLKNEAPFFKKIVESFVTKNIKVLDVSCGTGFHLIMHAKWGYEGVGVDISEQNIEEAERLSSENNVDNQIRFIIGDIRELEDLLKEEKFDFIYCIGNTLSIFNLEDRTSIINQMLNLLDKDGKILIQTVNYLSHSDETEWFYNPKISRTANDAVQFHVRMMEWKEKDEKVIMYVHSIKQNSKESEEFELHKKRTEFFVPKIEDLTYLKENQSLKINLLGDYFFNDFDRKKSNDLVIIIDKE